MSKEVYGIDIGAVYMVLTRGLIKSGDYIGDVLRTSTDVRLIPYIVIKNYCIELLKYLRI